VRTFAAAVGEAEQFLRAFRCRADDDENALRFVFQTRLQMDAIGPYVDIALGKSSCQPSFSRLIADAESPGASLPSRAASASEKSPVEMPLRYRIGSSVSIDFERRM
jgi:hypothetical protein